ncbi:flagella basal body P-ring formation protein FlgA [Tabrizicola sp. TH137]|uniref:flagellar basal body P-ring formation chaperone FlgA n=1 Tax=Tabrizicola sp. TH137 TaxID=2067452 RepID=UPI000C7E5165|nr:flagellar basal body P-ring formation chaperone FlgA [Tabrizicola sp. TH137]PLL14619.1 flagella basal body P-ring formation protein FlgA [Tabrizicola sp. TH137]
MRAGLALLLLWPCAAAAMESLVATRAIPAQTVLTPEDIAVVAAAIPGALSDPAEAVGQATRRIIYPGRPILGADLGPPVMVARNALVRLEFRRGGLHIAAEGRALDEGALGAAIRVMALGSRSVLQGVVAAEGLVLVEGGPCAGC